MSRGPNPLKLAEWRERLERFDSLNQTVAQFCADEGVSPPSFYQWKKRLDVSLRARAASARQSSKKPAFKPVELISAPMSPPRVTTIRLTNGVAIELGNDLSVVNQVLQALVPPSVQNNTVQNNTAEGQSC